MLKELSKLDSEWRKIALKICNNKMLSDDLVNDMYLKMHKLNPKTWNNELGLIDREILLHTHEKSLRKTANDLLMSYGKVNYKKKNALKKLINTDGVKNWKQEKL